MTKQRKEAPGFLSDGLSDCEVPRNSRLLHPYLQLFISVVLTAAAQVFLKLGVDSQADAPWYALFLALDFGGCSCHAGVAPFLAIRAQIYSPCHRI
jgi:hypothetical protein